jgi:adenylate cyclase
MTSEKIKRKLTAILSADVKGYSRLMGEDEEWTLRTLNTYKGLIRNLVGEHRGRVVASPGDNLLAEFASVVGAVECAVEIQQVLRSKNALLPETRKMDFRIGINVGDVIEEGDSIYGDGVNIAARLEGLAEAGGICISGSAYDQIENKIPLRYDYLGEHAVKNIAKPVRVYRARIDPEGATEKRAIPRPWQMATIGLVVAAVAALVIWKFYIPSAPQPEVASKERITAAPSEKPSAIVPTFPAPSVEPAPKEKAMPPSPEKVTQPAPPPVPKMEVADKKKMAFPLPDQPSIAVLPFVNMSEDPKQEFFCDGITESIITALSKLPRLFVIARNSTFTYKGKPVKVKQLSEELGVRYVLEGSVQRSADRIRINAQLIDALKGHHLWAERYDRDLKDIFALQDEITIKILTATRVKLTEGEGAIGSGKYFKGKQGLDCYFKFLEAASYHQHVTIEDNNVARRIAEEAVAMCPDNPMPYVLLGWVNQQDFWLGNTKSPQETIEKGIELAQKALSMDNSISLAYALLSEFYSIKREHDKAIAAGERAVALAPSSAIAHQFYGLSLVYACRPEEGIPLLQRAIRLNPFSPTALFTHYGHALRGAGRFEEAVSAYKKAIQLSPNNIFAHFNLAVTFIWMDREQEARAEAAETLRINPKFSLDWLAKASAYKDPSVREKYH